MVNNNFQFKVSMAETELVNLGGKKLTPRLDVFYFEFNGKKIYYEKLGTGSYMLANSDENKKLLRLINLGVVNRTC